MKLSISPVRVLREAIRIIENAPVNNEVSDEDCIVVADDLGDMITWFDKRGITWINADTGNSNE